MCAANPSLPRKKRGQPNGLNGSGGHRKEGPGKGLLAAEELPRGVWCHALNQETMVVGGSLADGASVQAWMGRELAGSAEEMQALLAEAAKMEPDAHGLTILPFFSGDATAVCPCPPHPSPSIAACRKRYCRAARAMPRGLTAWAWAWGARGTKGTRRRR